MAKQKSFTVEKEIGQFFWPDTDLTEAFLEEFQAYIEERMAVCSCCVMYTVSEKFRSFLDHHPELPPIGVKEVTLHPSGDKVFRDDYTCPHTKIVVAKDKLPVKLNSKGKKASNVPPSSNQHQSPKSQTPSQPQGQQDSFAPFWEQNVSKINWGISPTSGLGGYPHRFKW